MFLVRTPPQESARAAEVLEDRLDDYGFSVQTSRDRLAAFMGVQNTYLAAFQSLGGLGLILGTFGLAAVQLRNVLERRRELALMSAIGFRRWRLGWMVLLETGFLLAGGLASGLLAALVAVLPHLLSATAAVPWQSLGVTLGLVAAAGLISGLVAAGVLISARLVPALRSE